ncbi:MAG: dual specificity protein phosphatase family protein [Ktedonobacterales bacterium]
MAFQRFYWLVEGSVAGCSRPGGNPAAGRSQADDDLRTLAADLAWLRAQGINALLTLTEMPLDAGTLAAFDIEVLHLPIEDLASPSPAEFLAALDFIDHQRALGRAIAVHCRMGQGRTGSILAAYLIRRGVAPKDALVELRAICPGAVENQYQEQALDAFAARRDWII